MQYATTIEILEAYEVIKDFRPHATCLPTNSRGRSYNELPINVIKTAMFSKGYVPKTQRTELYIAYRAKLLYHPILSIRVDLKLAQLHARLDSEGMKALTTGNAKKAVAGSRHHAIKKKATIELDEWDKKYLFNIYKTAQWLSSFCKPYHVDHIIPLAKGGLHTPNNLQILPAEVNIAKSDKLDFYN